MTETPTVHQAWAEVMGDVQAVRKDGVNRAQNFAFRGIDSVMNAVGPALRKHGVAIIPEALDVDVERYQTAKGGQMQGVILRMRYTVYGPAGDCFHGSAYGQAADAGDKAMSKAASVAYRTFLLQSLTVPTDEPDPDEFTHQRADYRQPAPSQAVNGVPPKVTEQQMKHLHALINEHQLTEKRHAMGSWAMRQVHPGHPDITSMSELTGPAASALIDHLKDRPRPAAPAADPEPEVSEPPL